MVVVDLFEAFDTIFHNLLQAKMKTYDDLAAFNH